MADFTLKRGDFGFDITFTITTSAGVAVDLTGKTVVWKAWREAEKGAPVLNITGALVTPASGICKFTVTANDTRQKGLFKMEVEYSSSGVLESTNTYDLEIQDS